MKIAFVTPYYNPKDVRRGSGTFYYMSRELEHQGCQMEYYGPIPAEAPLQTRALRFLAKRIQKKRFLTYLDPGMSAAVGNSLEVKLANSSADLLLTNDPGVVAGLDAALPMVYYSDVMLPASKQVEVLRQNFAYKTSPLWAVRRYQRTMQHCLEKASLLVFPAQWQADEAVKFGVDPIKIRVISFGANIPDPGSAVSQTRSLSRNAGVPRFNLLFLGSDWERKGGNTALQVTELLRQKGVEATLDVVGLRLEDPPHYVRFHGLLRKDEASEWELMNQLFLNSDALILPSRSEGSVIAPREAAAYGLPTLAFRIPGLANSVLDGTSGVLLDPDSPPQAFCQVICSWLENPEEYLRICRSARKLFEEEYQWASTVKKLRLALKEALEG